MFDPSIGKWISEDPEGFAAGDVDLYRYCGNAPTVGVDPYGQDEIGSVIANKKPQYEAAEADYKSKNKITPIPISSAAAFVKRVGRGKSFKWVLSAQGLLALPVDDPNVTHTMATDPVGEPVVAAGWGQVGDDNKIKIDNDSGHYAVPKSRLPAAKGEFERAGFEVEIVNDVGGKPKK